MAKNWQFAKDKMVDFIEKYFLNGKIEGVVLEVADKEITSTFKNLSGDLRGFVKMDNFPLDDCEIGCYNTGKLLNILSLLSGDIDIQPVYDSKHGYISNLILKDAKADKGTFSTAELDVIERDGKKSTVKDYETVVNLSSEMINKILKAYTILDKATGITFENRNGALYIVFGKSDNNSDNFEFDLLADLVDDDFTSMSFPAEYLKEILTVNSRRFDADGAKMEISNRGIMRLYFKVDNIEVEYWLVKLQD